MRHFDGELRSIENPFTVISDHQNFQYFTASRQLSERQVRWAETLARFKIKIVFRPGSQSGKPDFLSRRAQEAPHDAFDERLKGRNFQILKKRDTGISSSEELVLNTTNVVDLVDITLNQSKTTHNKIPKGQDLFENKEIATLWDQALEKDHTFHSIHASVASGQPSFPSDLSIKVQITDCAIDERGALVRRGALWVPDWEPLRTTIIQHSHDSCMTGHPGRDSTLHIVSRTFFWPQQYLDVRKFTRNCSVCSRTKAWRQSPQGLLRPLPVPERFHSELSVDFMTDLPANTDKDPKYLMVITDRLLKSCTLEAMNSMEAEVCAERFLTCHYRFHGFPKFITSDRGANWVGHFWTNLCRMTGINQRLSTAYHPQTDGSTERMNQEVLNYLRAFISYAQTDWPKLLPTAMLALNNRKSSVIGNSPFFVTHGYDVEPIQQTYANSRATKSPQARAQAFVSRIIQGQELAQAAMTTAQHLMEESANQHRRPAERFKPGDSVWLNLKNVETPQQKKKLSWTQAKYRVQKEIAPDVYQLDVPTGIHNRFFVDLLRRDPNDPLPSQKLDDTQPPPLVDGDQPLFAVDKIVRAEKINGYRKVLVFWKGFAEPTWEHRENLKLTDAFKEFVKQYGEGDKVGLEQGMFTGRVLRNRTKRNKKKPGEGR